MSGEGASVKKEFVDGKEVVEKSCVVNFRPCKDWRGEYGFDWVREEYDEFEERIDHDSSGREKTWFLPVLSEDKTVMVKGIEDYLKKKLGRNKDGKSVYESKMRQHMRDLRREHANDTPPFDFEKARENYIVELYQKNYDPDLWKQMDPNLDDFHNLLGGGKLTAPEDNPIEYLYDTSFVEEVCYKMDRDAYGDVWWMDSINYKDMANGYNETKNATELTSVVAIDYHHQSLKDDNGSYFLPMYLDNDNADSNIDSNSMKMVHYVKEGFNIDLFYGYKPDYLGGGKVLKAVVSSVEKGDADAMWFYFEDSIWLDVGYGSNPDNVFFSIHRDGIQNLPESRKKELDTWGYKRRFLTDDIINNVKVDIFHLCRDSSVVKAFVKINNPVDIMFIQLSGSASFGYHVEKEKPYWGRWRIQSWKEYHQDSFGIFPAYDQLVKTEGWNPWRYCIPVLSIGVGTERYRFTFRSLYDAPKIDDEKSDVYNLQLFIRGNRSKKLCFKYDRLLIRIEPKDDIDISNKDQVDIKIKLICGRWYARTHSHSYISVWTVNPLTDDYDEEVGRLRLKILDGFELKTAFIKVQIDKNPFPPKLQSCFHDQICGITNAMSQIGIHTKCKDDYSIRISKASLDMFKQGDEYVRWAFGSDGNVVRLGDILVEKFIEQYPKEIDMHYEYLFFFLNVAFTENVMAYASIFKDYSYVVSSSDIASQRMCVYTMAHEVLHRLNMLHTFQLCGHTYRTEATTSVNIRGAVYTKEDFCFPISSTTNIMDYFSLAYSLRKEQWDTANSAIYDHEIWTKYKVEQAWRAYEAKMQLEEKKRKKRKKTKKRK